MIIVRINAVLMYVSSVAWAADVMHDSCFRLTVDLITTPNNAADLRRPTSAVCRVESRRLASIDIHVRVGVP